MNHPAIPAFARRLLLLGLFSFVVIALLLLPRPGAAQDPVLPAATPESLPGLELFADRCANCHGEGGQGDGELIAQAGTTAPMPFDEAYIRAALPSIMFTQITDGEAAVGMPPFGPASSNPIDETGRWNLVAAVYSLATPPQNVEAGRAVYEAQCAACHGDAGAGDGPEAATDPPASDLTDGTYWFNRSNQTVFDALAPGAIPAPISAHTYEIAADDLWRAVDYARTFSYVYADPAELNAPIPAGVIFGTLANGTTGEKLGEAEVSLRGFTPEFQETLTLTTTTDVSGNFRFDVTDVPPDLIYIAGAGFDGLNFSSGANQLSRGNTTLELPVTVYDKTSDVSGINVGQLHVVLEFAEDVVTVNELYIINNAEDAVFIGPTGDPDQGVIEVAVPDDAQNLQFQRSFGSMDSFLPANDFVQTERGWADPLPLRPGDGAETLLVRYELPYTSGMTIAHPMYYDTATTTIIMPDAGVDVTNTPWVEQPPQSLGEGQPFRNYSGPGVPQGETITIGLEGRPNLVTDTSGATIVNRDQTTELLISGAALLLTAVAGVFLWRYWQRRDGEEDEWQEEAAGAVAANAVAGSSEADTLLHAIADLDDTFEAGGIAEADYQAQRAELKRHLAAIWKQ